MTVSELIAELRTMPQDREVWVWANAGENDATGEAARVYVDEEGDVVISAEF